MNHLLSRTALALGTLLILSLGSTGARADNSVILPAGSRMVQPAGLGTVNTVLALQSHGANTFGSVSSSEVPEPASMALLGTGLAGLAGAIRRRRNSRKAN